jgi:ferredoxin
MSRVTQESGATTSAGGEVDAFTAELKVVLGGAGYDIRWPSDRSLVSVMIEANIAPPHSCLVGKCGACVCTLVVGQVVMDCNEVLDGDDLADNYILGCQARPFTQKVEITFD